MNKELYMLGILFVITGGFLIIYSVLETYAYTHEILGHILLVTGFVIGVIGIIVPEAMTRNIVIGVISASIAAMIINALFMALGYVPTVWSFIYLFIIVLIIVIVAQRGIGR
jgi:hypothetical protein